MLFASEGPHGQVIEEGPGLLDPLRRLGEAPGVIDHHIADHALEVPAGEAVVADVGHALRRQVPGGDLEDLLLHLDGHPGEDPVADQVIEPAEVVLHVHDAHLPQLDIGQPQRPDGLLPLGDLAGGQIDPHEPGAG